MKAENLLGTIKEFALLVDVTLVRPNQNKADVIIKVLQVAGKKK